MDQQQLESEAAALEIKGASTHVERSAAVER
jgi:hypothetical protein